MRDAVVLSGGGANGAYSVGVMAALFGDGCRYRFAQPVEPEIFTGTSVGAFNAAIMASLFDRSPLAAVRILRWLWVERIGAGPGEGNGVYRPRGDWRPKENASSASHLRAVLEDSAYVALNTLRSVFDVALGEESISYRLLRVPDAGNLISSSPLRDLIAQTIDPRRLLDPRARVLRVIATDWDEGKAVVFYNRREEKKFQPSAADYESRALTVENARAAIQASASVPGVFPMVPIGDHVFVDGGVVMNSPLHPAIQAGASVLHVVHFESKLGPVPFGRAPSLLETLERMAMAIPSSEVAGDLVNSRRAHELRRLAHCFQRYVEQLGDDAPPLEDAILDFLQYYTESPGVTVHVYCPSRPIGGLSGLLDFRRERIIRLIELGFEDTLNHDCEASGCIV